MFIVELVANTDKKKVKTLNSCLESDFTFVYILQDCFPFIVLCSILKGS